MPKRELTPEQMTRADILYEDAAYRVIDVLKECLKRDGGGFGKDLVDRIAEYLKVGEGYLINIEEEIGFHNRKKSHAYCERINTVWNFTFPYIHKIYINPNLLEQQVSDRDITSVFVHEILHSVADNLMESWQGHKGVWAYLASVYNELYPDEKPITRTGTIDGVVQPEPKYVVGCPVCKWERGFAREVERVRYPERFRCKTCGSTIVRIK